MNFSLKMAQRDNMSMKELYLSYDGQATERTNSSTSSVDCKYSTKENCILSMNFVKFCIKFSLFFVVKVTKFFCDF